MGFFDAISLIDQENIDYVNQYFISLYERDSHICRTI
jgi:hypothetical protein